MTELPQTKSTQPAQPREGVLLAGFLIFNAVFRLSLLSVNEGVYTDGILQITQFGLRDSFWPPLYTAAIWVLRGMGVDAIDAGRLISIAAATALVVPLWTVARAWGGRRAALFAAVLYTASPLALRWSLRVMTDMPFLFLFHLACAGLLGCWSWREKGSDGIERRGRRLALVTLVAVLATLTRYQGLLLLPLVWGALVRLWLRREPGRLWATLAQVAWLALPACLLFQRFGHVAQVLERRSSLGLGTTLVNYWFTFESFLYIVPYVLTLPVFCLLLYGLFRGPGEGEGSRRMPVRALLLYTTLLVLVAQSVFQSFLSRYLLPMLPLALVIAGAAMARLERRLLRRSGWGQAAATVLTALVLTWSLGFGMASVFLQREAFRDIYRAGRWIRDNQIKPEVRVFSNESYKPTINGVKLAYASGRPVELIPELAGPMGVAAGSDMPVGSIVAIHSAYGGTWGQRRLMAGLMKKYRLARIPGTFFGSRLVPLLPDIMENPGSHQNPLAWGLRYQRQMFRTTLYSVTGKVVDETP